MLYIYVCVGVLKDSKKSRVEEREEKVDGIRGLACLDLPTPRILVCVGVCVCMNEGFFFS